MGMIWSHSINEKTPNLTLRWRETFTKVTFGREGQRQDCGNHCEFRISTVTILHYPLHHQGMKRSSISGSTSSYPDSHLNRPDTHVKALLQLSTHAVLLIVPCLKRDDSVVQGARRKNKGRMMCHARYPETPNAPVLGVPSSICKEI